MPSDEPDKPLTLEQLLTEAKPIIANLARDIVKRYRDYIELADLEQDGYLWVLESEDKVRRYLTPTDEDEDCEIGRKKLRKALRDTLRGQGAKAKAGRLGYSVHDDHYYSPKEVEKLLPLAFNYDAYSTGDVNDELKSKSDPATGNNHLPGLIDVKTSFLAGSEADQVLLWGLFVQAPPEDEDELAATEGVTRQTIVRRANRALGRVSDRLGGPRPDFSFNGRVALSNAQARFMTENPDSAASDILRRNL